MRSIFDVAKDVGLAPETLMAFGPHMAKLTPQTVARLRAQGAKAKLVLVSAITPTKHGEGKTTTSIGLAQGLWRRGKRAVAALREPSLGPIFGAKGGGTGGGRAMVEPSGRINLHFTGDFHAVTSANNLLATLVDNALHFRTERAPDPRSVSWRRALDMNDRSLRQVVQGLGGTANGVPREDGFDITAASEVMAVLCLAADAADLKSRLGRLVVGYDAAKRPVTAGDLEAVKPMAALLYDALQPNLVQTTEGTPALVHGGPFANIAHGCNSIIATRSAAALGDYVVTEAGFGFDLGGEKFLDLKCRAAMLWPSAVVLVVTVRALKHHGGDGEGALEKGLANLDRHVAAVRHFGLEPVVAVNVFAGDAEGDLAAVEAACRARSLPCARSEAFSHGGAGAEALADLVVSVTDRAGGAPKFAYALEDSAEEKIRKLVTHVYGGKEVAFSAKARAQLARARELGFGQWPVCMAKTNLSLTDDPSLVNAPRDFTLTVREVSFSAGAGFLLVLTGEILTMPGLPRSPAAFRLDLGPDGEPTGVT